MTRDDVLCTAAIFLAVVMASAAGIGGGAVLVPLFTMLGGFTEHEAIPLSIATIFGGCAQGPGRARAWAGSAPIARLLRSFS